MIKTTNNKIFVKPYQASRKIRANTSSGFSSIEQKQTLIPLIVMYTIDIVENGYYMFSLGEGDIIFVAEEMLMTQANAFKTVKFTHKNEEIEAMIVDHRYVLAVDSQL